MIIIVIQFQWINGYDKIIKELCLSWVYIVTLYVICNLRIREIVFKFEFDIDKMGKGQNFPQFLFYHALPVDIKKYGRL